MLQITAAGKEERELLIKVWETGVSAMRAELSDADLTFVGRKRMRELNKATRGVDRVTDVLSFPTIENAVLPLDPQAYAFDVDPGTGRVNIGSVVICRARAKEQAKEYGHSYEREVSYLLIHGLLHLLSFDHVEETGRAAMRKQEERILSSLDIRR